MKNYRIHAFLQTLSPLHITSPESARMKIEDSTVVYGESVGIPLNQVQRINVQGLGGATRAIPVIAANNLMGRMRRHGATKVLDALRRKGEKVAMSTYSALQCGAATGKPDGRDVLFTEYREASNHPYIGLFGGGPRMMRRNVRCFNAVPYMECSEIMFGRNKHPHLDDEIHKASDARKLTQCWILNRNDDLRELINLSQAQASITDFEKEITKRQEAILADSKGKAESGESSTRHTTRSFSSFEFVIPGVYFPLCFELMNVDDAQVGLFLLAFDSFAATERLGGHARNGMGQFSITDVMITDDGGNALAKDLFSESRLNSGDPFVQRFLQAWSVASEKMSGAELDRLFAPPPADEAKGKKAKAVEAV
ncbi:type IV CRISPR-associated protein Csf2 [Verminephrobacter aporrectodeae]|nr:type IV CRISPR-associated protein Csf2 [Verminephrobacter aporrectodeae]